MSGQSVDLVGPFNERRLVIDGWSVPLIEACELDGGQVHFKLDHRMGLDVDAKDFERVARFLADTVAVCLGYNAHPYSDEWYAENDLENPFADQRLAFAHVPHPALAPRRTREISAVDKAPDPPSSGGK